MKLTKLWLAALLTLPFYVPAMTSCATTNGGEQGIELIEEMDDLEFEKWNLYLTLGVKIGANRLLEEQLVTPEELNLTALALDLLREQPLLQDAVSILQPALEDVGLNNDEIMLLMLIVEQELLSRGVLDYVDPLTGLLALSPRTETLLVSIADALRSATTLSPAEMEQGKSLGSDTLLAK